MTDPKPSLTPQEQLVLERKKTCLRLARVRFLHTAEDLLKADEPEGSAWAMEEYEAMVKRTQQPEHGRSRYSEPLDRVHDVDEGVERLAATLQHLTRERNALLKTIGEHPTSTALSEVAAVAGETVGEGHFSSLVETLAVHALPAALSIIHRLPTGRRKTAAQTMERRLAAALRHIGAMRMRFGSPREEVVRWLLGAGTTDVACIAVTQVFWRLIALTQQLDPADRLSEALQRRADKASNRLRSVGDAALSAAHGATAEALMNLREIHPLVAEFAQEVADAALDRGVLHREDGPMTMTAEEWAKLGMLAVGLRLVQRRLDDGGYVQ
jgi:hypothetical protein